MRKEELGEARFQEEAFANGHLRRVLPGHRKPWHHKPRNLETARRRTRCTWSFRRPAADWSRVTEDNHQKRDCQPDDWRAQETHSSPKFHEVVLQNIRR
jgi:hypothetical protein